jgi:hypothetical protein
MRTIGSLAALLVATAALGAAAPPATAGPTARFRPHQEEAETGLGIRLTEAPMSAAVDPRATAYIVDHLAPGTVIERKIEVANQAADAKHVVLYSGAATIGDGSFSVAEGDTPNELSTWTTVSPAEADIAAGGTLAATVKITVPADATPGETYGAVWAQAQSGVSGGVTQVTRVGIRLYLSVGPGGAPAADFTIDQMTAGRTPEGDPVVSATVTNTGGRALDMTGELKVFAGPGGLSAGPFPATLGTTLGIGETQPVSVALDERLPAGPWTASITLKSGLTERTVEATLTFPAAGPGRPVKTRVVEPQDPGSEGSIVMPALIGVAALLGLATTSVVLRGSRRRRRPAPGDDGRHESQPAPRRPATSQISSRGRHARAGR